MKYLINELANDTLTNASGYQLYAFLKGNFEKETPVEISFENCPGISSSFLNSSFGELIEEFGFARFRRIVNLTGLNQSLAQTLKGYFKACCQTV